MRKTRTNQDTFPRALGLITVAYSAAIIAQPRVLAGPCGFVESDGRVPRSVATLIRAIGLRDVASGLAMVLAQRGAPLRTAIAVRAAADLSDAVLFAVALPDPKAKRRIAGFAAFWGVLCAASTPAA